MGWTIEIAGVTPLTVEDNAKFNLRTQNLYNEVGLKEFIETFIEVEADIVAASASTIADNLATVREQVSAVNAPRNVTIKLDGTTKFEFLTNTCIASPRVEFHETIDEEGNGDSHWRYKLGIYVKQVGNVGGGGGTQPTGAGENVFELHTSLKTIKDSDRTTRKIWMASCKAKTIQEAKSFIVGLRPKDDYLHEEIEMFFQDQRVTASWVWEVRQKGDIFIIEEPMSVVGYGARWIDTPRVDDASPILHKGRRMAFRMIIRGIVRGYNKKLVENGIPSAHFSETKERKRLTGEETSGWGEPKLVDHIRGLYEMPYEEVWISTEDSVPTPKHGSHNDAEKLSKVPSDGKMPTYTNV